MLALHESDDRAITLTPGDLLSDPPYHEARDGWTYFSVPLAGDDRWARAGEIETVQWITLGFDSWGAPPLAIRIDGLSIE